MRDLTPGERRWARSAWLILAGDTRSPEWAFRVPRVPLESRVRDPTFADAHLPLAGGDSESLLIHSHFEGDLVSGQDRRPETRAVNSHEVDPRRRAIHERIVGHCLRKALNEQYARNKWLAKKGSSSRKVRTATTVPSLRWSTRSMKRNGSR